jgi:hypothetical protein
MHHTSADFVETEYDSILSCSGVAARATLAPSAATDPAPANAGVVGAAVIRDDQSCVAALPRATRMMMNNCVMPYYVQNPKKLASKIRISGFYLLT